MDVDPGASTNRTVYTFVGKPEAVVNGALAAARTAFKKINMTKHKGEHPRIGALDVCPFVPVRNVTSQECVELARQFAQELASELEVPVFLYEEAASCPERKNLADIRKGEYEGLKDKLANPNWKPDFGPDKFVPRWGASVVGARKFLIAYNVNLLCTKNQAHRIALDIREMGRGPNERGTLKCCKALGWYLEEQGLAQVSVNLTDFEVTNIHHVYEECSRIASELHLPVVGSEIVGLVPLQSLLLAAEHYIQRDSLFILEEKHKIRLVTERLGLSSLDRFKPEKKVIEYRVSSSTDGPLVRCSVRSFIDQLSARTGAPGGGSASALVATIGASLATMVGWMTYGWRKYEHLDSTMRQAIGPLHEAVQELLALVDADSAAFEAFQAASQMPKKTEEEKKLRQDSMQKALKGAIITPLSIIRCGNQCWHHLVTLSKHCNLTTKSDLQVGACSLKAGIQGAKFNVDINLESVKDEEYKLEVQSVLEKELETATAMCDEVLANIRDRK